MPEDLISHLRQSTIYQCLYLNLVPVLSHERILGLLLETFLSLRETLVPIADVRPWTSIVFAPLIQSRSTSQIIVEGGSNRKGELTFRQP